jgi:hypothetical protein
MGYRVGAAARALPRWANARKAAKFEPGVKMPERADFLAKANLSDDVRKSAMTACQARDPMNSVQAKQEAALAAARRRSSRRWRRSPQRAG